MEFTPELQATLQHFAEFADAVIIHNGKPICVSNASKTQIARARVDVDIPEVGEDGLPIFNIRAFNKVLSLFKNKEFETEVTEGSLIFRTDDGFSQEFYLSRPDVISNQVPKAEKIAAYIESEFPVEFELSEEKLKQFLDGMKANTCADIVIRNSKKKTIELLCADIDEDGKEHRKSGQFVYNTGISTDADFRVGFSRDVFNVLPGSYTVRASDTLVFLEGAVVDYILPNRVWGYVND